MVRDCKLDPTNRKQLEEWLSQRETRALLRSGEFMKEPTEWAAFRARALADLAAANDYDLSLIHI